MAWTASVTNKEIRNGIYYVTLTFTDGVKTVVETYNTASPTEAWIPNTVRVRLAKLQSLDAFDITIGPVTPSVASTEDDFSLFRNRLNLLVSIKALVDLGIVQASNPKVVALGNWIKNNFDLYFGRF